MLSQTLLATLLLALGGAHAKTDYEGCTSFTSTVTVRPEPGYGNTYNTIVWYVPDTLEICKGVDCGGGRAPPKAVPGCGSYHGTETVTPEFLTEDPMKPTQAVESKGAKETGTKEEEEGEGNDGGDEKDDDEKEGDDDEEEVSSATTITTSSKPAENASVQTTPASESESKEGEEKTDGEKESKTESKTENEAESSTTTGGEGAEQTGDDDDEDSGAAMMSVNGLVAGFALAVVLML